MSLSLRRFLSLVLVFALALPISAMAAAPAGSPNAAEVRGVLLSADGTPAIGYQIGLRSKTGDLFLSAPTGADGAFAVETLPPDGYRVVAFAPDGAEFPVLGREVALKAGQAERIEARLGAKAVSPGSMEGSAGKGAAAGKSASGKRGIAAFWGTTGGKVAIIVGGIFAVGLAANALSSDDNKNNNNPSPSVP